MSKKNSRNRILDAAKKVVLEVGANHLTLDAVAAKAGVSKGGLLYNFPSKDMLLKAMIRSYADEGEMSQARERARLPAGPGREVKAHVRALLDPRYHDMRVASALLAAAAHDPKLIAPLTGIAKSRFDDFAAGGLRYEHAAVIGLAAFGLHLMDILRLSFFTGAQRDAVIGELMRLADGQVSGGPTARQPSPAKTRGKQARVCGRRAPRAGEGGGARSGKERSA